MELSGVPKNDIVNCRSGVAFKYVRFEDKVIVGKVYETFDSMMAQGGEPISAGLMRVSDDGVSVLHGAKTKLCVGTRRQDESAFAMLLGIPIADVPSGFQRRVSAAPEGEISRSQTHDNRGFM